MTIVLLAVGLLVSAAGFVTIGFGIPINTFSLGNTLILAGTIAATSGLILIALAVLIGHLRRIGEALKTRPVRVARVAEIPVPVVAPPLAEPVVARMPTPPQPEPVLSDLPTPEPRLPATASEPPAPLDWLRSKSKPASAPAPSALAEPPVVDIADEAPLSPKPPQRPPIPAAMEHALETKTWSPGRPASPTEPRLAPRVEPPRAAPPVETQRERERFDLMWPDRVPPSPAPPQSEPARHEPALEMPLPPPPTRPRDNRVAERRVTEAPAARPAAERGPAILKSGVIDGMPYTLYADGSIEADLPTGLVKFASVDALRAHLEKQG